VDPDVTSRSLVPRSSYAQARHIFVSDCDGLIESVYGAGIGEGRRELNSTDAMGSLTIAECRDTIQSHLGACVGTGSLLLSSAEIIGSIEVITCWLQLNTGEGAGIGLGYAIGGASEDTCTFSVSNVTVADAPIGYHFDLGSGIGGIWLARAVLYIHTCQLSIQNAEGSGIGGEHIPGLASQNIGLITIIDYPLLAIRTGGGACIGSGLGIFATLVAFSCESIYCRNCRMILESDTDAGIGSGDTRTPNRNCTIESLSE
jgi:hypothetical protein